MMDIPCVALHCEISRKGSTYFITFGVLCTNMLTLLVFVHFSYQASYLGSVLT